MGKIDRLGRARQLPIVECRVPTADCRLASVDCRPVECRLRSVDCGVSIADRWSVDCGVSIAECRLPTGGLSIAECRVSSVGVSSVECRVSSVECARRRTLDTRKGVSGRGGGGLRTRYPAHRRTSTCRRTRSRAAPYRRRFARIAATSESRCRIGYCRGGTRRRRRTCPR
jgi:hypothetical protein